MASAPDATTHHQATGTGTAEQEVADSHTAATTTQTLRTGAGTAERDSAAATTAAPDTADPRTAEIVRRLKSVEGHVRGVGRMVGDGSYCIDVVNQIVAVQRALKKVNALVLDRHLHTCVTSAMRSRDDDARERVIEEIMGVFEASGKL